MATKDLKSHIKVVTSIKPDDHGTNVDGAAVDTRGFESATVLVTYGATVHGSATVKVQASVDSAFTSPVDLTPVSGPEVGALLYGDAYAVGQADAVETFAYVGEQYRYIRVVGTIAGATHVGASVILGHPHDVPAV